MEEPHSKTTGEEKQRYNGDAEMMVVADEATADKKATSHDKAGYEIDRNDFKKWSRSTINMIIMMIMMHATMPTPMTRPAITAGNNDPDDNDNSDYDNGDDNAIECYNPVDAQD